MQIIIFTLICVGHCTNVLTIHHLYRDHNPMLPLVFRKLGEPALAASSGHLETFSISFTTYYCE